VSVLELRNASVHYGALRACDDVSLTIERGQIVTVVGESGCGKSTVGKLCLGVQRPTAGEVYYDGRSIWAPGFRMDTATRLLVNIVHQDPFASLNPVKTVEAILSAPLRRHGVARGGEVRQRVLEALETVGLNPPDSFAAKYPFQMSGGQRQRVSIARAMLLKPALIIADEPVSAVDASLRLSILDLMRDVNQRLGIAFLYITHDLATARYFGKGGQLVVMYLGKIVEQGETASVIDAPRHPYLQALLAALPPLDPRRARERRELPLRSLDMPDPRKPPSGCAFHPRCPYAEAVCETEVPLLRPLAGNQVRCHLAESISARV
jgi:peptide/nickel transport system ATP-binding protein